jgi:hypothetical protein
MVMQIKQDGALYLLNLFVLGTEIQPLDELGDIEDIDHLVGKLMDKRDVQAVLTKNIFTKEQIKGCIDSLCQ